MRIFSLLAFAFIFRLGFSQADPALSLFPQNKFWFNPAHCAMEGKNIFSLSGRNQWINLEDNPRTLLFSFEKSFDSTTSRHAVGFVMVHDQQSFSYTEQIGLNYRYGFPLSSRVNLYSGARISGIYHTMDFSKLITFPNDTFFPKEKMSAWQPAIDIGLGLGNSIWSVGLSAKSINAPVYNLPPLKLKYGRYYFLTASYKLLFGARSSVTPSVLIHYNSFTDIIFNATYSYNEMLYLGLSFKGINNANPCVISVGFKIKKRILIMAAYDIPGRSIASLGGSYEGILKYRF